MAGNPNHDSKTGEFSSGHQASSVGNQKIVAKVVSDHERTKPVGYHIIDSHTNIRVGKARTSMGAIKSVDKRDNAYGAYRYRRVPIYDKEKF